MNSQTKTSPDLFGESYFKTGNYSDYSERGPRYHQIARELSELFETLSLVGKGDTILDFGCGLGFLAEGLESCGFESVFAYDKSEWARSMARERAMVDEHIIKSHCMIALDVLEHMEDDDVIEAIKQVDPSVMVFRIPVAEKSGCGFHLQVSRNDPTHINCKTADEWIKFLKGIFEISCTIRLNMHTIYDSPGVACFLIIR